MGVPKKNQRIEIGETIGNLQRNTRVGIKNTGWNYIVVAVILPSARN